MTNAERAAEETLALPIYPELSEAQTERVTVIIALVETGNETLPFQGD